MNSMAHKIKNRGRKAKDKQRDIRIKSLRERKQLYQQIGNEYKSITDN